jgi:agmatine deiminase
VVDFRWTEYGMPAWCNTRWGRSRAAVAECVEGADDERADLDRHIGGLAGASIYRSSIAVEGGAFETNGQGTVIANAQLYRSRNPARPLTEVDAALKRLPGVRQVIWVPAGLAEDPHLRASITRQHIGWGTGGHTDEFIRFAGPRTVLLAWPDDADVRRHPVSRITRSRMAAALAILNTTRTPDGQPWNVLKLPMPRPIQRVVILSRPSENDDDSDWQADEFPPEERRRPGDKVWEMAVATYMNFVVANGVVVLPDYRAHGTPPARQLKVQRVMEQAFPGRRIAFVDAISANWVGGGMHCATLNEF